MVRILNLYLRYETVSLYFEISSTKFPCITQAVLASVIVVALKGMLMQMTQFVRFWKLSKLDAAVWMVTFLTVVFVSIDVGLLLGVVMSLLTILILGFKPYTCLLEAVPHTDIYLDVNRYKGVCVVIF